jgi:hypothetical protein
MIKKQLMARKPAYRHGQLLLEDDFIAEQQFHAENLYRHAHALHGFGAATGLVVSREGDMSVTVSPGYAVDRRGHEIALREPETLELRGLPPGSLAWITLGYRTEQADQGGGPDRRIDCYAVLRAATGVETNDVRLAAVQLDERGYLKAHAIQHDERDVLLSHITPGSVTAESLADSLRKDWLCMPFHPTDLPSDQQDWQPPFRVGATQAVSHEVYREKPNTSGAAGTMPLVLPPGVRHLHRLRVAGPENEKKLKVSLVKGGYDEKTERHLLEEVLVHDIGPGAYCVTLDIPEAHRSHANRLRTLAVALRAEGKVKVSLVGLEVSF